MKYLCDEMYPAAELIRVVLDNLNTHALGSLFATYPPDEAWRPARRLELHFTPKHASRLNMAECELSVLSRQCLDRRLASQEAVAAEVGPWEAERNRAGGAAGVELPGRRCPPEAHSSLSARSIAVNH
jgi:hypothetical protein